MRPVPSAPAGATRTRYQVLALAFLGLSLNYIDRANLSVALPFMADELHLKLSNADKGLLFGAFFWAYDGFMLLAGWFADKVGPRKAYAFAAVWWSIFTVLTSLAGGFWSLFAIRFALGAGESPAYPSATKANSRWFPRHERAFAAAVVDSGSRVGSVLALPVVTGLMAWAGWRSSFVVLGAIGLVWAAAWFGFYRDPEEHPRANALERAYLSEHGARIERTDGREATAIRWPQLFRYRTIRGMMLGFFCLNFVIYFFLTWFPTYLKTARGFDLQALGTKAMIPGLFAVAAAWLAGRIADGLIARGADITRVRKTVMVGGLLGGAVIVFVAMVHSMYAALALLSLCYASLAVAATGIWSLPSDVAPSSRHVASIGGIQNFASNIAGIISPWIMGWLLDRYHGDYTPSFALAAAVAVVGAASYGLIVGRAEPISTDP